MKIDLYPLTELLEFIVDNRGKTVPTEERGIVLIATNCIKNNELFPVFEKVRYLSRSTYENWFRAHPIPGDIIFVNKGTPGRVCLVPEPVNFCIAQDMVAFRANPGKIYNKYLFAALRSESIQVQIGNMHVGTLIPHVKKSHLDKLLIPVPDIDSQRAIGDFYYDISYKIELNNRIIANLEAQAQAIFKCWFVDFEPFQDGEFDESELGLIPKEWRVFTFSDVLTPRSEKDNSPDIPEYSVTNTGIYTREEKYNKKLSMTNSTNKIIHKGDLIFGMSRTILNWGIMQDEIGGVSSAYHVFKVDERIPPKYLEGYMHSYISYFGDIIKPAAREGQGIDKSALYAKLIYLPCEQVISDYYSIEDALTTSIESYKQQNVSLEQIRDTLLPKLMSGEIEVPVEE